MTMSRRDLEKLESGKFRRKVKRKIGIFIDGTGLDRATRRLNRKVDLLRFMASLTSGLTPDIARYYTLVPYEDDARQLAFLEAVERAGLEVCLKRLPPKGVKRPVSMDVHIGIDMVCFSLGAPSEGRESPESPSHQEVNAHTGGTLVSNEENSKEQSYIVSPLIDIIPNTTSPDKTSVVKTSDVVRETVLVCPNRELSYALYQCHRLGARTSLADFGLYGTSDGWRGVDTWVDLSISETIWRE